MLAILVFCILLVKNFFLKFVNYSCVLRIQNVPILAKKEFFLK
jgi:hypothetical protein